MPRLPRIWFPGALYHVVARGDNREPLFFVEQDYRHYLKLLAAGKPRYGCQYYAYALMTNHVHLMIRTGLTHPLSKLMQSVNTAYTFYMHKRYRRVGHIFQGRYHSVLVDTDSYALELSRYIHLNPVRAGMVSSPEHHPWSSYRAYLYSGSDSVVEAEPLLAMMSPVPEQQRPLYSQFVNDGLPLVSDTLHGV